MECNLFHRESGSSEPNVLERMKRKKRRKYVRVSRIISRKNLAGELNGVRTKEGGLVPTMRPTRMAKCSSLPLITGTWTSKLFRLMQGWNTKKNL